MRRPLFALFLGGLLLAAWPGGASATFCLPPIFEGGRRLHELPEGGVAQTGEISPLWLELLLRQHEVCWRTPPGGSEVRMFLFGSSAAFGLPLPVQETAGALLNEHFRAAHLPAHVYNLGFVWTYQLKDALILHESLQYRPDVIIYAVTLADFTHVAPLEYLTPFFESNDRELAELAREPPAGLSEPATIYHAVVDDWNRRYTQGLRGLRVTEFGGLVRAVIRQQARSIRRRLLSDERAPHGPAAEGRKHPPGRYDCGNTKRDEAVWFQNWKEWNILAYLERIRATAGVEVLVVNWPVANDPVDDCYNVRYSQATLREYNQWLGDQARARGLRYVDLHDLLARDDFVDSLHVGEAGHRQIAGRLEPAVDAVISAVRTAKGDGAVHAGASSP